MFLLAACAQPKDDGPLPRDQWPDRREEEADTDTDTDADTDADADTDPAGTGGSGGPVGEGTDAIGSSSYAYYAPACAAAAHPVAVVYTHHGSGGNGAQMVALWRAQADAACFVVIGLDSESSMSWNFEGDVSNTSDLVDRIDAQYDVGWRYLHGYSAGAHWSYVIGLANTAVFAGLGVYAGTLYYAESYGSWPPDRRATPIPVAIGHGTGDTTVPYSYAEDAYASMTEEGWPADLWTVEGGTHAYDAGSQDVAWAFWLANR
ncbi:MAG: alpha/beta hydrolase family esterase [Myxococcota bacterium]